MSEVPLYGTRYKHGDAVWWLQGYLVVVEVGVEHDDGVGEDVGGVGVVERPG